MTQPDVFEQMVEQVFVAHGTLRHQRFLDEITTLLRRQHANTVRLVKRQQGWERDSFCNMVTQSDSDWLSRKELLAKLKEGTR